MKDEKLNRHISDSVEVEYPVETHCPRDSISCTHTQRAPSRESVGGRSFEALVRFSIHAGSHEGN
jgi:hypothetical protein